jgi:hypothetical protein
LANVLVSTGEIANMEVQEAIKSDGSVIRIGDEVEAKTPSGYFRKCEGVVFVVESIQDLLGYCKTGYLVLVHVKDQPDRKLLGFKKEGREFPDGLDADWFVKINVT